MNNTFLFRLVDDYRTGPHLYAYKWEDGDKEKLAELNYYQVEIPITTDIVVYHAILTDDDDWDLIDIGRFSNKNLAEQFAKEQYYLYTGDFPFIVDGMTMAYKSTGNRKEITIPKDAKCKIEENEDDALEYLLISNGNIAEGHSLDMYAEW